MIPIDPPLPQISADKDAAPHRRVRSFVLRMGRMTAGQERAFTELWPLYGIEFSPAPLDLDACFGRRAPRILEIGFGTGDALQAYAQMHPEHDCLGIEVHRPGVGHLLLRAEAQHLSQIRVICHDAVEVLKQQIPAGSLAAIHIFFPDPWPKKRHHKRRLIQPAFVDLLAQALAVDGVLRLATDWEHYAEQMRSVLDSHVSFINLGNAHGWVERPDDRPLTRFERRGHRLGHGVWDLAYRRK